MLHLCCFTLMVVVVHGSSLDCKTRLDVITEGQWPILKPFNRYQLDMGHIVSVGYMNRDYTQAVLHDLDKRTYIYPDIAMKEIYGISVIRELVEIPSRTIMDILYGYDFVVILTEDGSVWTVGRNHYGQLSGDTTDRPIFKKVQGVPPAKQIAVGQYYVILLTNDGRLFSWGDGSYHQLGYITALANPTPRSISGITSATSICCSSRACIALANDSEVITWGHHQYIGRLGPLSPPAPVSGIPSEETIIKMSCGEYHIVALSSSGRLYGWGYAGYGQLLQATSYQSHATVLDLGGKIVRDVVAGRYLTIVRTNTDDVYYFGLYDGSAHFTPSLASDTYLPRDLMARGRYGQETYGAVKLGCKTNPV